MVIRSYSVFAAEQVTGYPIEMPDAAGDNHRNQQQKSISGVLVPRYILGLIELLSPFW